MRLFNARIPLGLFLQQHGEHLNRRVQPQPLGPLPPLDPRNANAGLSTNNTSAFSLFPIPNPLWTTTQGGVSKGGVKEKRRDGKYAPHTAS